MKNLKKENFNKVNEIKNKILNFYPFVENNNNTLTCKLTTSSELIFKLFYNGGTVDLCQREITFGIEKEKSIILSFSFENDDHRQQLFELLKKKI